LKFTSIREALLFRILLKTRLLVCSGAYNLTAKPLAAHLALVLLPYLTRRASQEKLQSKFLWK